MATKIRRVRRIGVIAIGTVKAIFHTGRAWGTARARVAAVRRPEPTVSWGAVLAVGAAGGAAGAYFLDPKSGQRRRRALGRRAVPAIKRAAAALTGRGAAKEAQEPVEAEGVQMAAGDGAPVPAKEPVAAS